MSAQTEVLVEVGEQMLATKLELTKKSKDPVAKDIEVPEKDTSNYGQEGDVPCNIR